MKYEIDIDLTNFAKYIGTYESDENVCKFIDTLMKEVQGTHLFDKICNLVQQFSKEQT